MCGICGIFSERRQLGSIGAMNDAQAHRGPDDEGYVFIDTGRGTWLQASGPSTPPSLVIQDRDHVERSDYDLVLGNRRLAILDVSSAGHMPMARRRGTLWVTYNGEIYNYRELREELETLGHTFDSHTDTEVLLAAYEQWGPECVSRFNGMFAFALWDASERRLYCARDRFGVKPFYYSWDGRTFVFASELKSLLSNPDVARHPNDRRVFDYLVLDQTDHDEESFFEGVKALLPGHTLTLRPHSRDVTIRRWWQLEVDPDAWRKESSNDDRVYEEFRWLLEDAVRLRLRSDVPVGSCLSGGLDSSAIVLLASGVLQADHGIAREDVASHLQTFTARYRSDRNDEYEYSNLIVRQAAVKENVVYPSGDQMWQELDRFVWHLDEPVGSTSQYAQWCVMRLAAHQGVTVLLDGQGADEVLGGYHSYFHAYVSEARLQSGTFGGLAAAFHACRIGGGPTAASLLANYIQRLPPRFQHALSYLGSGRLVQRDTTGVKLWQLADRFAAAQAERHWRPFEGVDRRGLAGVLLRDLTTTNLPKLLRYEDRNSTAFSREARLPFLDYRLVQFSFGLPPEFRIRRGWTKWILRQSLDSILPRKVCWRRSKFGFPTPERKWLLSGVSVIRNALALAETQPHAERYLSLEALGRMRALPDEELVAAPGVWRIVNLLVWMDLYFERRAGEALRDVEFPSARGLAL